MTVEQCTSHTPEGQITSPKKNEVRWNGKTLKIPRLIYERASVEYSGSGDQVFSIDPADQKWIQIGTYGSLKRAKARVRLELDMDSERHKGGSSERGHIVLTMVELGQALKYGEVLPQSPEKYAQEGKTHVAFGPALKVNEHGEFLGKNREGVLRPEEELQVCRNMVGVWRPVSEIDFEKYDRHTYSSRTRHLEIAVRRYMNAKIGEKQKTA